MHLCVSAKSPGDRLAQVTKLKQNTVFCTNDGNAGLRYWCASSAVCSHLYHSKWGGVLPLGLMVFPFVLH